MTEAARCAEIDLRLLNGVERGVLELLAEGHTAKSIATLTGRSVAAVNERLREARRKTGIGSSRELARLVRVQKNRDEEIDLAAAPPPDAAFPSHAVARQRRPRTRGRIAMIIIVTLGLAAAIATHHASPPGVTHVAADPQIHDWLAGDPYGAERLHDQLGSQSRDTIWADGSEAALRARYGKITHVADSAPLRVTSPPACARWPERCRATMLCPKRK